MTCVVGVVGPRGQMILGGDSASTEDWGGQVSSAQEKVWPVGEFLIGGAGSWRGLQLARYAFKPPKRGRKAIDVYMVTDFIDALRETWKKGGHLASAKQGDDFHEETISTNLIVAYRGSLWIIEGDLQILPMRDPYAAIGSGVDVALGSLYATREQGATKARVLTALRAAERYNNAVRSPFIVVATSEAA